MKEILIGLATVGVAVIVIALLRRKCSTIPFIDLSDFPEETVEGELHFKDIVDFFRTKHLEKGKHIPFIGFDVNSLFKKVLQPAQKLQKEGYKTILLDIYNEEQDNLEVARVIHCTSTDKETQAVEAKATGGFIVLS